MQTSTVKWFDSKKGYGFIEHPNDGEDVFVHYSNIESDDDFKTLESGQQVEFEMNDGPKGLHAVDVVVLDDDDTVSRDRSSGPEIGPEDVDPTAEVNPSLPDEESSP